MVHDVAYYLSHGFDPKMANYFASGRKRLVAVKPINQYQLQLTYEGNDVRLFDCTSLVVSGKVFKPLQDQSVFNRAYVDDGYSIAWDIDPTIDSNIVWNNKIDLSADTCYVDSVKI